MAALSRRTEKVIFWPWISCESSSSSDAFFFSPRKEDCIQGGLDSKLVNPDGGVNIEHKRQQLAEVGYPAAKPDVLFPESGLTKLLKNLPIL